MPEPLPKSFKWLIRANIFLAIVLPISQFGFQFFCFGGCPLLSAPFGFIFIFASMVSMLAFYAMVCIDLFFVFRLWKVLKTRIFIPIGILALGLLAGIQSDSFGRNLAENRFFKYFDQYEQVVKIIKDGKISSTDGAIDLPSNYRHLAMVAWVDKDPNNSNDFVAVFGVGSGGFAGHTAYLYSSTGTILEGSLTAKHWPHHKQVKDKWFRASD